MSRIILALSLSIALSWSTLSQEATGGSGTMEDLVKKCQGNGGSSKDPTERVLEDAIGTGHCVGFISGILSGSALAESILGRPLFCLPKDGISFNEAEKIYFKYAKDHPEQQAGG